MGRKYGEKDEASEKGRVGLYEKFYGLPLHRPIDRHRWFFSYTEASMFMNYHVGLLGYHVKEEFGQKGSGKVSTRVLARRIIRLILGERLFKDFFAVAYWCVLERD